MDSQLYKTILDAYNQQAELTIAVGMQALRVKVAYVGGDMVTLTMLDADASQASQITMHYQQVMFFS